MIKMKCSFVTSVGQKKIRVPDGNRIHGLPDTGWGALTTELRETLGELGHFLGSYLTRVLHTAGISNVEIIAF